MLHAGIETIPSVGPENFLVVNAFHRGPYGPPPKSNWTPPIASRGGGGGRGGVRTSISKET